MSVNVGEVEVEVELGFTGGGGGPGLNAGGHALFFPHEKTADKIKRLQAEAASLACQDADSLIGNLRSLIDRAAEIAGGGNAYPVGVREQCRQLADNLRLAADAMQAILERESPF